MSWSAGARRFQDQSMAARRSPAAPPHLRSPREKREALRQAREDLRRGHTAARGRPAHGERDPSSRCTMSSITCVSPRLGPRPETAPAARRTARPPRMVRRETAGATAAQLDDLFAGQSSRSRVVTRTRSSARPGATGRPPCARGHQLLEVVEHEEEGPARGQELGHLLAQRLAAEVAVTSDPEAPARCAQLVVGDRLGQLTRHRSPRCSPRSSATCRARRASRFRAGGQAHRSLAACEQRAQLAQSALRRSVGRTIGPEDGERVRGAVPS